jgi:hypothetical protein
VFANGATPIAHTPVVATSINPQTLHASTIRI